MKKRALCFLTAAILFLLPWAAPADGCLHSDPSAYVVRGRVEPQVGVAGYSGDYYCPLCGAKMVSGHPLPALEPPAGPGSQTQSGGTGSEPEKPETPVQPKQPADAAPAQPGQSSGPAKPETPVSFPDPGNSKTEQPAARESKPAGTKTNKSGNRSVAPKRFSADYPYRRVRMAPVPGIRAEAAGTLVRPKAVSPFQKMLTEP